MTFAGFLGELVVRDKAYAGKRICSSHPWLARGQLCYGLEIQLQFPKDVYCCVGGDGSGQEALLWA